ncbi:MAG: DUF3152 domain-containing protein [Propionibacteriaceae bacterium]|nr:DUF3152 domain-containing protein [Propionibacteriaceae bacterium]
MSEPNSPGQRFAAARKALSDAAAAGVRLGPRLWGAIAVGALLVIALAVWANALVTPVTRAGHPTTSVAPLPATAPATPTPSATATGEPTAGSGPSTSPTPKVPRLKSSGKFDIAGVNIGSVSSSGALRRYSVRVETTAKLKADKVARQIAGVLNDPRSWTGSGGLRFAAVADPAKAHFSITLGAPGTAGRLCDLDAAGTCTDGADVVVNAALWSVTPTSYAGNTAGWQAYLVNHGMGQLLGERNAGCEKKNRPAPVMMPQLGDLEGCTANPWPYP